MEVDSLNVKISAEASSASKSIDELAKKLGTLSNSLKGVSGSNLSGLSNGVNKLASATAQLKGVKAAEFTRIANAFEKFAKIDSNGLNTTSNAMNNLARSMSALGNVPNLQSLTPAINAIKNLAKVDMTGFDTGKMANMANSISGFATQLAGVGAIDANVTRLVSAMARLAGSGASIGTVSAEFPALGTSVISLVSSLAGIGVVDASITKLVDAISKLANAGSKISDTVANLDKFGDGVVDLITKLQSAPEVSTNLANTIQGLGNLAAHGISVSTSSAKMESALSKLGSTLKNLAKGALQSAINGFKSLGSAIANSAPVQALKAKINGLTSSFTRLIPGMKSAEQTTAGFASTIGMFYAKCFLLIRGLKKLGSSIESAMDYIETYNYFQAAFGQVSDQADLSSWKELGYKSAEEYADSFQDRAEELTSQLTGYKVEDSGLLSLTGETNLGLNPTDTMNYQAMFAQMSSSMGVASDTATTLSNALTKIGADLASVKNLDFTDVWDDMASGLTGMSRTWDKYGANIRNANLQTQLDNLGIDASISKLGQQDKVLLRTITLLNSTRYAWGDMASTINQPANQLRIFKNNMSEISRILGQVFLPVVQKVLPYLNAFAIAVKRLISYVATLLGVNEELIKSMTNDDTGVDNSAISDALDAEEDLTDQIDDATEAQKKFNKQLQGFDELNNLSSSDSTSSSSSSSDDSTPNVTDALTSALNDVLSDYEAVWQSKFEEMQNDAEDFADKIQDVFVKAWQSGDGSDIGTYIAQWINKGIDWVNGNVGLFSDGLNNIASILATSFNGFVKALKWEGLGSAIGTSIKAALEAETVFFEKVNWVNLGSALATSLNSAIDTGVLESYFTLMATKLKAAIETAFGAIETFDFSSLGSHLGKGINDALSVMSEVNEQTGLNGWQTLATDISDGLSGIITTITTALDTIQWYQIGQAISDFIKSMDTKSITWNFGELVSSMLSAFYILVSNKDTWTELGTKIGDGINGFFDGMSVANQKTSKNGWETLGGSLSNGIEGLLTALTTAIKTLDPQDIGDAISGVFESIKFKDIGIKFSDLADALLTYITKAIKSVKWKEIGQGIADFIKGIKWGKLTWDLAKLVSALMGALADAILGFAETDPIAAAVIGVIAGITITATLSNKLVKLANLLWNTLGNVMKVAEALKTLASTIASAVGGAIEAAGGLATIATSIAAFAAAVGALLVAGFVGLKIGKLIGDALVSDDMKEYQYDWKFSDLFTYSPSEWIAGLKEWIGDTLDGIKDSAVVKFIANIATKVADFAKDVAAFIGDIPNKTIELVTSIKEKVAGALSALQTAWGSVTDKAAALTSEVKEKASGALDALKNTWSSIKDSTAAKTVSAIKEKAFETAKDAWDAIKTGTVTKTLAQQGKKVIEGAKTLWNSIKNGTARKTLQQTGKSIIEGVKTTWEKIKNSSVTKTLQQKGESVLNRVKKTWDSFTSKTLKLDVVTDLVKTAIKNVVEWINKYIIGNLNKLQFKVGDKNIGINIPEIKVPSSFATGGYPERAQLFYAREDGIPELVGRTGSKTTVMNNDQIVQSVSGGVSDAVFNALNPVLSYLATSINQMNSGNGQPLYVDGVSEGDIVKIVTDANKQYKNRTGKPLLA